jgi:hypothetical protein
MRVEGNDERRTMCCSPFVTQSLAADVTVREFEGRAFWPVGLTAREEGTAPTSLAGSTVRVRSERLAPDRTA